MGPTWGPSGSCRPQMGSMVAPWTLLSGKASWSPYIQHFPSQSQNIWQPLRTYFVRQSQHTNPLETTTEISWFLTDPLVVAIFNHVTTVYHTPRKCNNYKSFNDLTLCVLNDFGLWRHIRILQIILRQRHPSRKGFQMFNQLTYVVSYWRYPCPKSRGGLDRFRS